MGLLPPGEAGRRIREARQGRGLAQLELAAIVGVVQSLVCQWERGQSPVSRNHLPKLAKALRVPVSHLLVDDEEMRLAARTDDSAEDESGGRQAAG